MILVVNFCKDLRSAAPREYKKSLGESKKWAWKSTKQESLEKWNCMSLTLSRWEDEKDDEKQNTWSLYQKTHLWNLTFLFYGMAVPGTPIVNAIKFLPLPIISLRLRGSAWV